MFKVKNLLFCASILAFSNMLCNKDIDCINLSENKEVIQDNLSDTQDTDLDFIDELIEAPKNPDVKPSSFRYPDFVMEYGMRTLDMIFYVKNSAKSKYRTLIDKLKLIYYRI